MEVTCECLAELGHKVRMQTNRIDPDAIPVVFGVHHVGSSGLDKFPSSTILFNLEQLAPGYIWFTEQYLQTLSRFGVWDYSEKNIDYLRDSGVAPTAIHVPFGYSRCLTRIGPAEEDVDVLFFGRNNDRRGKILLELAIRGLRVLSLIDVWGAERDAWIARSKLVINMHLEDGGQFEIVRVLFLLANGKAVVSEVNPDEPRDKRLHGRFVGVPYDELVDACLHLLSSPDARTSLQGRAAEVSADEDLQALPGIRRAIAQLW